MFHPIEFVTESRAEESALRYVRKNHTGLVQASENVFDERCLDAVLRTM
jgi:hypothetical protein